MPLLVKPPTEKKMFLTKTDEKYGTEGDPTYVVIIQATQGQFARRNDLFAEFKRTYEKNGDVVVTQHLSFDDIQREEVFLTMRECNILGEDGTKPLFPYNNGKISETSFRIAWDQLPRSVANEIHEKVLEINPQWTEAGEASEAGE